MEVLAPIVDLEPYLRAIRRRMPFVVFTAGMAAFLTILLLLLLPRQFRATADVVVTLPPTQTGSLLTTSAQAVSDFEGAIRSTAVAERAAIEANVETGSVLGKLETEPLVGGTVVEVSFMASDPVVAETVVETASREANLLLLEARLAPIEQLVDQAERSLAIASADYDRFISTNGLLDPALYFRREAVRLNNLRIERDRAVVARDDAAVERLEERIDAVVDILGPLQSRYDTLVVGREQAQAALTEARSAFANADAAVEAARDGSSVQALPASGVSLLDRLPRQILVVVVVATALTIAVIVLLELIAPADRKRTVTQRGGPAAGSAPTSIPMPEPVPRTDHAVQTVRAGTPPSGDAGVRRDYGPPEPAPIMQEAARTDPLVTREVGGPTLDTPGEERPGARPAPRSSGEIAATGSMRASVPGPRGEARRRGIVQDPMTSAKAEPVQKRWTESIRSAPTRGAPKPGDEERSQPASKTRLAAQPRSARLDSLVKSPASQLNAPRPPTKPQPKALAANAVPKPEPAPRSAPAAEAPKAEAPKTEVPKTEALEEAERGAATRADQNAPTTPRAAAAQETAAQTKPAARATKTKAAARQQATAQPEPKADVEGEPSGEPSVESSPAAGSEHEPEPSSGAEQPESEAEAAPEPEPRPAPDPEPEVASTPQATELHTETENRPRVQLAVNDGQSDREATHPVTERGGSSAHRSEGHRRRRKAKARRAARTQPASPDAHNVEPRDSEPAEGPQDPSSPG